MEKKTVLAVILSIVVIIIWHFAYVQPKVEKQKEIMRKRQIEQAKRMAEEKKEKGPEEKKQEIVENEKKIVEVEKKDVIPEKIQEEMEYKVTIKNKFYKAEITNVGGRILSWELAEFEGDDGKALELINTKMRNRGYLPLGIYSRENPEMAERINLTRFRMNMMPGTVINLNEGSRNSAKLVMEYSDGEKTAVEKILTFYANSYLVGLQVRAYGELKEHGYILLGPGLEDKKEGESGGGSFFGIGGESYQLIIGKADGEAERTDSLEETKIIPWRGVVYTGVETLYFASLFSSLQKEDVKEGGEFEKDGIKAAIFTKIEDKTFDKVLESQSMAVGLKIGEGVEGNIFLGPKDHDLAQSLGFGELVDFGFWRFLALPLLTLLNWINGFVGNYGVAIIVMTLIINLIFYPLRQKSFKSMSKMKELQPKINAIRNKYEKFKKDVQKRQEMNQEVMALYRKEGVSPTGGCLPLLIQFPFLIAIYRMLAVAIELRHAPFILWIQDLSVKDPYYITPIVMGFTMWYQNKMSPSTPGSDQTTAKMMKFLPILFTFMFLNFPSGLVLYWLFNNILAIGQQYLIKRKQELDKGSRKGKLQRR